MRKTFLIISLLLSLNTVAVRRALVIGIGPYPDVDGGWHAIHGDNDIALVCEILKDNHFDERHIATLRNEQATYDGIMSAIGRLTDASAEGDTVVISFSGHGQQITDLNGDEPDGYDEAWIPYDALQIPTHASYHGERHITDDMLNTWLTSLREKIGAQGHIVVIADACHSGDSTRGMDGSTVRGTNSRFTLDGEAKPFGKRLPMQWLLVSACSYDECNREATLPDGTQCGSLTYALWLMRGQLGKWSAEKLLHRLRQTLKTPLLPRPQTPHIQAPQKMHKKPLL